MATSNVDDWVLEESNKLTTNSEKAFIGVYTSFVDIDTALIQVSDSADEIVVRLTIDELEALATLLLYKAKLIRENNV